MHSNLLRLNRGVLISPDFILRVVVVSVHVSSKTSFRLARYSLRLNCNLLAEVLELAGKKKVLITAIYNIKTISSSRKPLAR